MERTSFLDQNFRGRPLWRDPAYTTLPSGASDTFDDRVNDDIFDAEDERAEVDVIVNGTIHNEQRRTI